MKYGLFKRPVVPVSVVTGAGRMDGSPGWSNLGHCYICGCRDRDQDNPCGWCCLRERL